MGFLIRVMIDTVSRFAVVSIPPSVAMGE